MQNVLIASLGESPIVVTAMVKTLAEQRDLTIDRVVVLYPARHPRIKDGLELIQMYCLCRQVEALDLDFADANTYDDCYLFLRMLHWQLEAEIQQGNTVYLSLAGGRKSMSALMSVPVPFYENVHGLYHLLDKSEKHFHTLAGLNDQFYTDDPNNPELAQMMNPPAEDFTIVDIPFAHYGAATDLRRILKSDDPPQAFSSASVHLEQIPAEALDFWEPIFQNRNIPKFYNVRLSGNAYDQITKPGANRRQFLRYFEKLRDSVWANKEGSPGGKHAIFKTKSNELFFVAKISQTAERVAWYLQDDKVVLAELGVEQVNRKYQRVGAGSFLDEAYFTNKSHQDYPAQYSRADVEKSAHSTLVAPVGTSPMVVSQAYVLFEHLYQLSIKQIALVYPFRNGAIKKGIRLLKSVFKLKDIPSDAILDRSVDLGEIDTPEACEQFLTEMIATLDKIRANHPDSDIRLLLSGGRKSMAALAMLAAQRAGLSQVYHTLVKDEDLANRLDDEYSYEALNRLQGTSAKKEKMFLEDFSLDVIAEKFDLFQIPVIPFVDPDQAPIQSHIPKKKTLLIDEALRQDAFEALNAGNYRQAADRYFQALNEYPQALANSDIKSLDIWDEDSWKKLQEFLDDLNSAGYKVDYDGDYKALHDCLISDNSNPNIELQTLIKFYPEEFDLNEDTREDLDQFLDKLDDAGYEEGHAKAYEALCAWLSFVDFFDKSGQKNDLYGGLLNRIASAGEGMDDDELIQAQSSVTSLDNWILLIERHKISSADVERSFTKYQKKLFHKAGLHVGKNDLAEAADIYIKLLEIELEDTPTQDLYKQLMEITDQYARQGKDDDAINICQRALSLHNPDNANLLDKMVDIQAKSRLKVQQDMMSYLTHTMSNSLSTGPSTAQGIIDLINRVDPNKGPENLSFQRAIRYASSLKSTFGLINGLLSNFKYFVRESDELESEWKNEQFGDISFLYLIAAMLRQTLGQIVCIEAYEGVFGELLTLQAHVSHKEIRASFFDSILVMELNDDNASQVLDWVRINFKPLIVDYHPVSLSLKKNGVRFYLLFACLSELLLNALKYTDAEKAVTFGITEDEHTVQFRFQNTFSEESKRSIGNRRGLGFIQQLEKKLNGIRFDEPIFSKGNCSTSLQIDKNIWKG